MQKDGQENEIVENNEIVEKGNEINLSENQIAKADSNKYAPKDFGELMQFAELMASSDIVPKDYRNKPANIVGAIQMGSELGLKPMQALQNIANINGRPSLWGDAVLAVVLNHPQCEDFHEDLPTDQNMSATCTIKRRGRSQPIVVTFSQKDAEKAGLWKKAGPWTQYPKRMLQMRARGFASRDAFGDALKGFISVEEARDLPAKNIIDQPAPKQIKVELFNSKGWIEWAKGQGLKEKDVDDICEAYCKEVGIEPVPIAELPNRKGADNFFKTRLTDMIELNKEDNKK